MHHRCGCAHWPPPAISRRALLRGATLVGATGALSGCGEADVGWVAEQLISPQEEAEMGRQAFEQMLAQAPVSQNRAMQATVARIGERIVEASDSPYTDWRFVVLVGDQANAFALPGGRVGVFEGMFKVAANEDQLATVIAHEVAHVNARHGAERMVTQDFIGVGLRLVATLLALGEVDIPPDLMVALGATAADLGIVKPFSRAQELEADALGLQYMARAGYDPNEAIAFWRRMQELGGNGGLPAFLATHPSSDRRIEELRELLPEVKRG